MKYFTFLALISILAPLNAQAKFSILHYNIKELDSHKIEMGDHKQVLAVKKVVNGIAPDFISLNEIQYDMPGVPTSEQTTKGTNIKNLAKQIGWTSYPFETFNPANTGMNARKKPDGSYYSEASTSRAREHADQVNFGVFPGQYSTGAISKFEIIDEKVITDLKWKDFNPNLDLSPYKLADGSALPGDMELFDKNFTDLTVKIEDKIVHIILLHTVPSFGFGNPHSVNDYRNAEQLRFLQWYLTGKTDYKVALNGINSLPEDSYYLAMGDLNVSIYDDESEGQKVLLNTMKIARPWFKTEASSFTNESSHYGKNPLRLLLDYILVSPNIQIEQAQIMLPNDMSREELGCDQKKPQGSHSYRDGNKTCYVKVSEEYETFKTASDHYPLYGEFSFR